MGIRFGLGWLVSPVRSIRFNRVLQVETQQGHSFHHFRAQALRRHRFKVLPFILPFKNSSFSVPRLFITCLERTIQNIVFRKREREAIQIPIKVNCMSCTSLSNF